MVQLTYVTACAPHHHEVLQRALDSVQAQTVPCKHIVVYDTEKRGAGWARNHGLAEVNTPFVVWLDADDWVAPNFTEKMLGAWRGDRYIYCDFWMGDKLTHAPECAWVNKTWHVITTLLPTAWARAVGGFDDALLGGEDTDHYLRLVTSGYCGKRLAEPLFHYGADGQRSKAFRESAAYDQTMRLFTEKYGRKTMSCGGCGTPNIDLPPAGEQQEGDVLAMAVWNGNRQERGRATGRLYARSGNGKQLWVDPRDAAARPDLFRVVENVEVFKSEPNFATLEDLGDMVRFMTPVQQTPAPRQVADTRPVAPVQAAPDVRKAVGLYRAAVNG